MINRGYTNQVNLPGINIAHVGELSFKNAKGVCLYSPSILRCGHYPLPLSLASRQFRNFGKSCWIENSQLRQHFAIDLDVSFFEVAHQFAVTHAV
jgi:hypothetical protein